MVRRAFNTLPAKGSAPAEARNVDDPCDTWPIARQRSPVHTARNGSRAYPRAAVTVASPAMAAFRRTSSRLPVLCTGDVIIRPYPFGRPLRQAHRAARRMASQPVCQSSVPGPGSHRPGGGRSPSGSMSVSSGLSMSAPTSASPCALSSPSSSKPGRNRMAKLSSIVSSMG